MNNELFEQLLHEEEGPTLDFKKEQYPFSKASDEKKSELLKDILGFANAWRRTDAYILIGVEDVRGGRANVIGISDSDHLDDHSVQQFVNNLTNRAVRFRYEAFGFEGKQVGIIGIEQQTRPIYLKRDYGKLKKDEVYVRRSSSTDPQKPAPLDEVATMRVGSGSSVAEIKVEFAHVDRDDALGERLSWDAECCLMPKKRDIPDYSGARGRDPFGVTLWHDNGDYYRERAGYEFVHRLFRPIRLLVSNVGQAPADNVRAELTVPANIGVDVVDYMPALPKRSWNSLLTPTMSHIQPVSRKYPGEIYIDRNDERFRVEIDCGDLQPGRRIWSDVFYIGTKESRELSLAGAAYAGNLPRPKAFTLSAAISVAQTAMNADQLRSLY